MVCFAPFPVLEANSANKFYDYLASGLPVSTNYQGWQEHYLHSWECGLAAEQGNTEAWAQNLLKLAADPTLRVEMGKNGRRLVEAHFDRDQLARQLLQIFVQVKET